MYSKNMVIAQVEINFRISHSGVAFGAGFASKTEVDVKLQDS